MNTVLNPLEGKFKTTGSACTNYSFKKSHKIYKHWHYLHLETVHGTPWYKEKDIDELIEFLVAAKSHMKFLQENKITPEQLSNEVEF